MLFFLAQLPEDYIYSGPSAVSWPLSHSGRFTVQSLNEQLRRRKFVGRTDFPSSVIWCKLAPTKVQCFVWASFHGHIATLDNLQRRGFSLPNRCALCCCHEESDNHLFIHCAYASKVWMLISLKLSIASPQPAATCQLIIGWKGMNCLRPFSYIASCGNYGWKGIDASSRASLGMRISWLPSSCCLVADGLKLFGSSPLRS
ncbi:hypothetical protein LINPERHAP1_LOCUS40470 [Linum perenne]